ncbi:MAG: SseB family protein [Anaerolineales bacterium]
MHPEISKPEALLRTLRTLRADPAQAVDLYRLLYSASFFAFVEPGSEHNPQALSFLTYACADGTRELPLFTLRDYVLSGMPGDAGLVGISGPALWPRLIAVVDWSSCCIAVDPGQAHGIRLTQPMVLGMIRKYEPANS